MRKTRDVRILWGAIAAGLLIATQATAQLGIAVVGDGLSATYHAPQSDPSRGFEGLGWAEVLTKARGNDLNFGEWDPTLDANRVPRGHAGNFAAEGARAVGSNLAQQAADAANEIYWDNLASAVVWIGAEDFAARLAAGGSFAASDPGQQAFQAGVVGSIVGALDTLVAAGATHVLLGRIPVVDSTRADVARVTDEVNAQLQAAAALRPQVTFFDPLAEIAARTDATSGAVALGAFTIAPGAAPAAALAPPPGAVGPGQCGFDDATGTAACPTPA